MKACDGNHPGREARPGPYTLDQCRLCWLYLNDPAYRALWADGTPDRSRPCVHRGQTHREEHCPTCRGTVRLKVFACARHGECTIARSLAGVPCCATCADYEPGPSDPSVLAPVADSRNAR
jgi:hypothetical protein